MPPSPISPDDEWARRISAGIASGSRDALASLYERRFDLLYRTARERTGRDESFALDCVQDAMMKVARSMPRFESASTCDAWLRRVVLTAALDRLRSELARRGREEITSRDGTMIAEFERVDELAHELASLSADDRSLLDLRYRRGMTLAQLALHFGTAPKAIDSRVRRVLLRIRERLGVRGDDRSAESPPEQMP